MKYIVIAFLFMACTNIHPLKDVPPISIEPLDTIQFERGNITATPVIFETSFLKGTQQPLKNLNTRLYGVTIGKLKVTSGRIIACDPMHIDEYGKPFTQIFPTGEFPVQLSIAKFPEKETIAFSRIKFSDEPVVKWEFALLEGQAQIPLGGEEIHGFSIDAGVAVFIDEEANKALDFKTMVYDMNGLVYREMDKHYHNDWKYVVYDFKDHNLAAFSSGKGDGYYASYVGLDVKGNPCRLLTDFNLFNWNQVNSE